MKPDKHIIVKHFLSVIQFFFPTFFASFPSYDGLSKPVFVIID